MATSSSCWDDPPEFAKKLEKDRIKRLYPLVNEADTPLPRSWSSKDKYNFIGLSKNNLRVHYKGFGKTHKDAASVKATHPIPPACGIYYYEVRIVSKGRDGYMGIGLATQGVNMNRLPGWDKNSYGYHGDDGHSFFSSGTGQPYGPTFTTGDVIGCGVNLVENNCFYTKNGHYLGIAFTDLPSNIYPTVGLQTPGEVVDANFGQSPFVFDIQDMIKGMKNQIKQTVSNFPLPHSDTNWQELLHKMVASYLVHQGYCDTAESFAKHTSQHLDEDLCSMRNRQKIQHLVLSGQLGEVIQTVTELYPGLLEANSNLLFVLKVRQFIEVINGTGIECGFSNSNNQDSNVIQQETLCESSSFSSTPSQNFSNGSTIQHTSVIQSTKNVLNNMSNSEIVPMCTDILNERNNQETSNGSFQTVSSNGSADLVHASSESDMEPGHDTCLNSVSISATSSTSQINDSDIEMDCDDAFMTEPQEQCTKTSFTNGFSKCDSTEEEENFIQDEPQEMDFEIDSKKICGGDPEAIEKMLVLGKELQRMSKSLRKELGKNKKNKIMLQNAFSLLAYNDPWNSPVGWQLDPAQRESISQALNSAILESCKLSRRPPLEVCLAQTKQVLKQMSRSGLGLCAFASVDSFIGSSNSKPLSTKSAPKATNGQH